MNEPKEILLIAEYEGLEIQEARLTYAQRQNLPATAFCGPDKTYPAHDARHVRAGLQRLSQFGKKLPRAVAIKIYRCLLRRAKSFGVEDDPSKFTWLTGKKTIQETFEEADAEKQEYINFVLDKYNLR